MGMFMIVNGWANECPVANCGGKGGKKGPCNMGGGYTHSDHSSGQASVQHEGRHVGRVEQVGKDKWRAVGHDGHQVSGHSENAAQAAQAVRSYHEKSMRSKPNA